MGVRILKSYSGIVLFELCFESKPAHDHYLETQPKPKRKSKRSRRSKKDAEDRRRAHAVEIGEQCSPFFCRQSQSHFLFEAEEASPEAERAARLGHSEKMKTVRFADE